MRLINSLTYATLVALALAAGTSTVPMLTKALAQSTGTAGNSAHQLSAQQRSQFIEGAKKVAHLTDAQIATALNNPDILSSVAVHVGVSASKVQPAQRPSSVPSTTFCGSVTNGVSYYNIFHQQLANFQLNKYWCWDGKSVTTAPAPTASGTVTQLGGITGWQYQGVKSQNDYFYYLNGNSKGGHYSYRQGQFTTCIIKIGCYQQVNPQLEIWAHYNGSYDHRERG